MMPLRRSLLLIVCAVFLLGLSSGCGSDDDEGSEGQETTAAEAERSPGAESARQEGRGEEGDSGRRAGENRASEEAGSAAPEAEVRRLEQERARESAPSPEEREAQERAQGFYDILGTTEGGADAEGEAESTKLDAAAFCDLMSTEAREETVDYARRSSGIDREWNCESAVRLLLLRSKRSGGLERVRQTEVVGVNAEGDRATATVRFSRRGPLTTIPMVREDGGWKLGASVAGP